jgi:hypothetical protein
MKKPLEDIVAFTLPGTAKAGGYAGALVETDEICFRSKLAKRLPNPFICVHPWLKTNFKTLSTAHIQ